MQAKKKRKAEPTALPLIYPGEGRTKYDPYTGYLTDFAVWVTHRESMMELFDYGSFGKGTLSRSKPEFQGNVMMQEQEETSKEDGDNQSGGNRRRMREQSGFHRKSRAPLTNKRKKKEPKNQQQSERDNDFLDTNRDLQRKNFTKRQRQSPTQQAQTKCRGWWPAFNVKEDNDASALEKEDSKLTLQKSLRLPITQEFLQLGLEESFFLVYKLRCLKIFTSIVQEPIEKQIERLKQTPLQDDQLDSSLRELTVEECFSRFCEMQPHFPASYAAYEYYRNEQWIPKAGLKYGGNFVLYRRGPAYYHAEWVVMLHYLTADGTSATLSENRRMNWAGLHTMNRASEQVAKGLLLCFVVFPDSNDVSLSSPSCIEHFRVQETVYARGL